MVDPSNEIYLRALQEIVANEQTERCDPTPPGREFVKFRIYDDIKPPIERIRQGDEYGEALLVAKDDHAYREGQIEAADKACQAKFDAAEKRKVDKKKLLEDTIAAADEAAKDAKPGISLKWPL